MPKKPIDFDVVVEPAPEPVPEVVVPVVWPDPDEHGRFRVRDEDTGAELTIHAAALPHGNYTVLDEPTSDMAGDPLPTVYPSAPVEPTPSGQQADTSEENK